MNFSLQQSTEQKDADNKPATSLGFSGFDLSKFSATPGSSGTDNKSTFTFNLTTPNSTTTETDSKPLFGNLSFNLPNDTASTEKDTKSSNNLSFNFPSSTSKEGDTTQPTGFTFNFPSSTSKESDTNQSSTFSFNFPSLTPKEGDTTQPTGFTFNIPSSTSSGTGSKENDSNPFSFAQFNFPQFSFQTKLTYNFGTGKDFCAEKKEFASNTNEAASLPKEDENTQDNIEDGFCESEKTGEEDEEILLDVTAKLFALAKPEEKKGEDQKEKKEEQKAQNSYSERGFGPLHFNHNKDQNFYRLIMRRSQIGTLILNQRVFSSMKPKKMGKNMIQFLGQLAQSPAIADDKNKKEDKKEDKDSQMSILLLKVKDEATADNLLSLINKAISETK